MDSARLKLVFSEQETLAGLVTLLARPVPFAKPFSRKGGTGTRTLTESSSLGYNQQPDSEPRALVLTAACRKREHHSPRASRCRPPLTRSVTQATSWP